MLRSKIKVPSQPIYIYCDRDDTVLTHDEKLINPYVIVGFLRAEEKRNSSFTLISAGASDQYSDPAMSAFKQAGKPFKNTQLADLKGLPIATNYIHGIVDVFSGFAEGEINVQRENQDCSLNAGALFSGLIKARGEIHTENKNILFYDSNNKQISFPFSALESLTVKIGEPPHQAVVKITDVEIFIEQMKHKYHGKFFSMLTHLLLSRKTLSAAELAEMGLSVTVPKGFTEISAKNIVFVDDHKAFAGDFEKIGCTFIEADTTTREIHPTDDNTRHGNQYLIDLLTLRHPTTPEYKRAAEKIVNINNQLEKQEEGPWKKNAGLLLQNLVERFILEDPSTLKFLEEDNTKLDTPKGIEQCLLNYATHKIKSKRSANYVGIFFKLKGSNAV
jgi:hypothetical protein